MKKFNYAALFLCACACCVWGYAVALRYYRFDYTGWDLPLYANLMWNLCHGRGSTVLFGGNFLRDHYNAIAFLLVPFYYFFQSALTLLYFKLMAFFAGAYVFYLLAAKKLGGPLALALMLTYMFYPANINMILFEFNFENLALPLIFLLFYFFEEKKFAGFMIGAFLLAMVKENMPLVVFMFGIYGLVTRRKEGLAWGLCPMALGAGAFIAEVFVFMPGGYPVFNAPLSRWPLYSKLGHSPMGIVRTFIFKEPEVLKLLFTGRNLSFLAQLFGPLLIPALLAPHILFLAAPLFLQDLLSSFNGQQSIEYFYASTLTVFIFMAAITFLGQIKKGFKAAYVCWIVVGLLIIFDLGYVPRWRHRVNPLNEKQWVIHAILSQIPADVPVMASGKFLSILSQRQDVYDFYVKPRRKGKRMSDDINDIAIDLSVKARYGKAFIGKLLLNGPWKLQVGADEVVLLSKKTHGERPIESSGLYQGSGAVRPPMMMDDALELEGLAFPQSLKFGQRTMRVVFYWDMLKDGRPATLPEISLSIFQRGGRFYLKNRAPFYGLPVEAVGHYREVFYYFIPKLAPGDYNIVVFCRPSTDAISTVYVKNISVL